MKLLRLVARMILIAGLVARAGATLPAEITVTAGAKLELMRGDKVAGTIGLAPGNKLALVDLAGDYALVRYRNLNGHVLTARSDLPAFLATVAANQPPPTSDPPAPVPAAVVAAPTPVPPVVAHAPANAVERALAGKLVHLKNGAMRPADGARLAGVKFCAIYFSASWCPPCREFTPASSTPMARFASSIPSSKWCWWIRTAPPPRCLPTCATST